MCIEERYGIYEKLKESVIELISDFQLNPFDYLYERDIQAALFSKAYSNSQHERISMIGKYHSAEHYPADQVVKTIPVKCEYPGTQKFDLAVIDANVIESYDRVNGEKHGWKNDRFWEQPVCTVIELKFMQLGDRQSHRISGFQNDIKKLVQYESSNHQFLGISMQFVQSYALHPEISMENMRALKGIDEVDSGIYGAVVSPSKVSWYERTTPHHSLQARRS